MDGLPFRGYAFAMIDLRHAFRQPVPRAAALMGAALTVLGLAALAARLADAPAPPGAAAIPPQVWSSNLVEPAAPVTRLATADDPVVPAVPARRAPAPVVASEPPLAAVPPAALAEDTPDPAPRAMLARLAQAAPPRRPEPDPAMTAAAPAPAAIELAARLALPEGPSALELALAPRGLSRSPIPPARPRRAELPAPTPETPAPGAILADRLDPPPPRPAAVARLAARPVEIAPLAATPTETAFVPPALTGRAGADGCGPVLARAIPRRPGGAPAGRAVLDGLVQAGGTTRDAALVRAVEGGNIPDHLRALVPVTMQGTLPDGRRAAVTLCVMPDYLAVGSDHDFVRIPLGLPAANRLAERFDMILPTARMVDAIHAQARVRLAPSPMTPGAQMASTGYLVTHNNTVEAQRRATGAALGALVSGHKKDLVLTNRLTRVAGRVAIYGWHRGNGQPIQPLSTVHGATYADYSHGVRLISRTAFVNGRPVDLHELLADHRYAGILSGDEGPIATRQILAALR